MLWHSKKNLFSFQQKLCLIWRRPFKSFQKPLSLSKKFPMVRILFLYLLQPWCLVIKNLSSDFSHLKYIFGIYFLLKETLWVLGLLLFWNHPWFYHASCGKSSQNPSLHFGATQTFCSNRSNSFFEFYFIYFFPKTILSSILSLDDLQRKCLISFEFWSQTNSSG